MFTGFYSRTDFYCFLDQDMSFKFNMDKGLSNESNSVKWDKTANKPNKYDPEVNFNFLYTIYFTINESCTYQMQQSCATSPNCSNAGYVLGQTQWIETNPYKSISGFIHLLNKWDLI